MRILHGAETIQGGIATYLNEILPFQAEQVGLANMYVLVPAGQMNELPDVPRDMLHGFSRTTRNVFSLAAFAWAFATALNRFKPDIIHLHSSFAGGVGRVLALFLAPRAKIVYCAHGWAFTQDLKPGQKNIYAFAELALAGITDHIINISGFEQRAALARLLPAQKMSVIVNAVRPLLTNYAAKEPGAGRRKRYLFVGRLDRQKGFDVLVKAVQRLPAPDFDVVVAGGLVVDAPATAEPLPPVFTMLGWQPRSALTALYVAADAVIMPSRWEGFGFVALEAMGCGTPVIASRCGALPEIVDHAENGLLFDVENPGALAALLQNTDADMLAAMGVKAAEKIRRDFSVAHLNRDIVLVYRKLCGDDAV